MTEEALKETYPEMTKDAFYEIYLTLQEATLEKELHSASSTSEMLHTKATELMRTYDQLPVERRDERTQTTAALAYEKAITLALQNGHKEEALAILKTSSSKLHLESTNPFF